MTPAPSHRPMIIPGFPHLLHGADYNPDQWLSQPEVIDEDFRLMTLAGCNAFSMGIFTWSAVEPEEGRFDFDWLDGIMDRMAAGGHHVLLSTLSAGKPPWMSLKYPEIRRVNREGFREPHIKRANHCWSSPIFREKTRLINLRLADRYAGHPALAMWHISNEYEGECLCELCLTSWCNWLRERYNTLDALNAAWWSDFWGHRYSDWAQIDPRNVALDGLTLDWMRFRTVQIIDFLPWETEPLREITPGIPCTTNFMGTHPWIDYSAIARHVDVISDDQYPRYDSADHDLPGKAAGVSFKHDLYRCFKPDRPWFIMESCPDAVQYRQPMRAKRPGLHRAEMFQALGHGAEGTLYFQWRKGRGGQEKFHGAVVDHVGHEDTRIFRTVAKLGHNYRALDAIIGSRSTARVAVIYDWDARWALSLSQGPNVTLDDYTLVAVEHYRWFWEQSVAVDVLAGRWELAGYDLVIVPQLWVLAPGVAGRLREFVERGGTLVMTYFSGVCDESNRRFTGGWPGDGLREVFGIWQEEWDILDAEHAVPVSWNEGNSLGACGAGAAQRVCTVIRAEDSEVLATYGGEFYAGTPAITLRRCGAGRAVYVAARLDAGLLGSLYGALGADLPRALPFPAPPGVAVQKRTTDEAGFLFMQNFTSEEHRVELPAGTWCDPVEGREVSNSAQLEPFGSLVLSQFRK